MNNKKWLSGAGLIISESELDEILLDHLVDDGKIYIGTDSQLIKKGCIIATTICLHNNKRNGGRYFYQRHLIEEENLKNLKLRMLKEVEFSINTGLKLNEKFPDADIEIHVDINSNKNAKTNKLEDYLTGYVKGSGFECKTKPDSWAASCIADKHSKKKRKNW